MSDPPQQNANLNFHQTLRTSEVENLFISLYKPLKIPRVSLWQLFYYIFPHEFPPHIQYKAPLSKA